MQKAFKDGKGYAVIMWIWALAAIITSIATILLFAAYRRQVKNTCRHLVFLKEKQTNFRLRSGLPFSELNALSDAINEILDASEKLKFETASKERNLKEAITNISHDIRTPLTSLDGYFQLLNAADSEKERKQYVDIIQNRINNLKEMLEELFTYTKLQDEAYVLQTEPMDVNGCVCSAILSFYNEFREKGIVPQTEFCEDSMIIKGNAEAVKRIVQNILKNVLEHGSKEVVIELKRTNSQVLFICSNKVENPENIDITQIFSRFYKADPARTHSSTGLGLAIAKSLAECMDGRMTAELEGDWFKMQVEFLALR